MFPLGWNRLDMNSSRKSILAWCLYDAGNSAFNTVIITFIFSVYFARQVAGDETQGSALWGYAMAASGFIVAILAPVMGAMADNYGARKPGLVLWSAVCVAATTALFFAPPGAAGIATILILLAVANTGFEMALVYANAMLPQIVPPALMGRVSGWAWGAGYAGGLICLALSLVLLVGLGDAKPLIPLPQNDSLHIRATAILTAVWFAVMTIPLMVWTHDMQRTDLSIRQAVVRGLSDLRATLRNIRGHKNLLTFLIGSAIYRDGLNTLFAVGGLYAAGVYGMNFTEILIFAIGLNITAGLGAALFAFADDAIGSKKTILISLAGLLATGAAILMTEDKTMFMILALALGIFIGPAQAAGRTLAARLAPAETQAQTFGLYAFTGRAVSFFGPLAFSLAVTAFGSQQAGMATILLFWAAGFGFMLAVRDSRE